jgi:hypothetical protein
MSVRDDGTRWPVRGAPAGGRRGSSPVRRWVMRRRSARGHRRAQPPILEWGLRRAADLRHGALPGGAPTPSRTVPSTTPTAHSGSSTTSPTAATGSTTRSAGPPSRHGATPDSTRRESRHRCRRTARPGPRCGWPALRPIRPRRRPAGGLVRPRHIKAPPPVVPTTTDPLESILATAVRPRSQQR